jgi:uncharacterized membrane protein YagU involved in acid resistance
MISSIKARPKKGAGRAILIAGLTAGVLDALAASGMFMINTNGRNPAQVWRYVASSIFKAKAYTGGDIMVVWGLLFHFMIAFIWTCLYFLVYPELKFLQKNTVTGGLLYGIFIWIVMNFIVVPLSFVQTAKFDLVKAIPGIIILMVCVGLPIALIIGRFYRKSRREQDDQ